MAAGREDEAIEIDEDEGEVQQSGRAATLAPPPETSGGSAAQDSSVFANTPNNVYLLHRRESEENKERRRLATNNIVEEIYTDLLPLKRTSPRVDVNVNYAYPLITTDDLREMIIRFGIPQKVRYVTGDQFVNLVVKRLVYELNQHINERSHEAFLNEIIDKFRALHDVRPDRNASFETLLTFFLGWVVMLSGVPDVMTHIDQDSTIIVPGLYNKALMCGELTTRTESKPGNAAKERGIDHESILASLTQNVQITHRYPSNKRWLSMNQMCVLTETLQYNKPLSADNTLIAVQEMFASLPELRIPILRTIDDLNSLIHGFDVIDMDNSQEFLAAVHHTALRRNIVFNAPYASDRAMMRINSDNMMRFVQCKMYLGMSSLQPKDFHSLFITPYSKVDTIPNIITAHALTSNLCLKLLESLLMLTPTCKEIEREYTNAALFDDAVRSICSGRYKHARKVHAVETISLVKRYTCLSLAETYLDIELVRSLYDYAYVQAEPHFWHVWHALFFRVPMHFNTLVRFVYSDGMTVHGSVEDREQDLINLPMFLLLDAYNQAYAAGGLNKVVKFAFDMPQLQHRRPRLYDPTAQIKLYHGILADNMVMVEAGDSYRNVCKKYLDNVFRDLPQSTFKKQLITQHLQAILAITNDRNGNKPDTQVDPAYMKRAAVVTSFPGFGPEAIQHASEYFASAGTITDDPSVPQIPGLVF